MRTEALDRVKTVFTLLDADGNDLIEAADFEQMARRVVEMAPGASAAAKNAMLKAFRKYWATLASELDANHDGKVSFDEYTGCVLSPERFDDTVEDFAEALAALGDPDGDGLIERPLFVDLMTAIGFEHDNIHTLFDAFGPDAEDRVRVTTWVDGIKDFYGPDKAGVAGDHLVPTPAA